MAEKNHNPGRKFSGPIYRSTNILRNNCVCPSPGQTSREYPFRKVRKGVCKNFFRYETKDASLNDNLGTMLGLARQFSHKI